MKLETIIINNVQYYQWKILKHKDNKHIVGDLFSKAQDIKSEREKLLFQYNKNKIKVIHSYPQF